MVRFFPTQTRFWREMAGVAIVVGLIFLALDAVLRHEVRHWLVRDQVIEPQSPSMLQLKLDALRRHRGYRVAVLGDSIVLGLSLKEHGDPDWQKHGLTALLERHLQKALPDQNVRVVNLGLNGALPQDLARIAEQLAAVQPDLVLCDIGLRAFSADFANEATAISRSWLAEGEKTSTAGGSSVDPLERGVEKVMTGLWTGYALRDTLQRAAFGGTPSDFVRRLHQGASRWLNPPPALDKELAEMELLMLAKRRFDRISLGPDQIQCQGLEKLLAIAQRQQWSFLLFYARENPEMRDNLIDAARYNKFRQQLAALMTPFVGDRLRYNEGDTGLAAEHYLDHVHVDALGYEQLLKTLGPDIQALAGTGNHPRKKRVEEEKTAISELGNP